MRSSRRGGRAALAATLLLGASGCGTLSGAKPVEEVAMEPAAPAHTSADLDLGPGVRPLSFGPGDKESPRISPSGDRVAFVLDGSVVEKALYARGLLGRTAKSSAAKDARWLSGGHLAVLGPSPQGASAPGGERVASLFVAHPSEAEGIEELAYGVQAVGAPPGGGSVVAAVGTPPRGEGTALVRVRSNGASARRLPVDLGGRVSDLSLSPDGREVVMVVRREAGEEAGRTELATYRFSEGEPRRAAILDEGMEVVGAPQQTSQGIYFVAGREGDEEAGYALYRLPEGSEKYEPVPGVGEGFTPASIAVSPDGGKLAVLGRRNSRSPTDLYVLDLSSGSLDAVTSNENMEIKTKPNDLAWSPDGSYVTVVARGALRGPKVYASPAADLSTAFFNVYEVPAKANTRAARSRTG